MEFDHAEKLAIVNVIHSVMLADGIVHSGEIKEMAHLMEKLDFDTSYIQFARNQSSELCLNHLKDMGASKKQYLAKLLEDMAKSDGHVHEKEKALLLSVFASVGIGEVQSNYS